MTVMNLSCQCYVELCHLHSDAETHVDFLLTKLGQFSGSSSGPFWIQPPLRSSRTHEDL